MLQQPGQLEHELPGNEKPLTTYQACWYLSEMSCYDKFEYGNLLILHNLCSWQRFYPINYLRNVAVDQVHTSHALFVDVDLVPMPGLYMYAVEAVTKYLNNTNKKIVSILWIRIPIWRKKSVFRYLFTKWDMSENLKKTVPAKAFALFWLYWTLALHLEASR